MLMKTVQVGCAKAERVKESQEKRNKKARTEKIKPKAVIYYIL